MGLLPWLNIRTFISLKKDCGLIYPLLIVRHVRFTTVTFKPCLSKDEEDILTFVAENLMPGMRK